MGEVGKMGNAKKGILTLFDYIYGLKVTTLYFAHLRCMCGRFARTGASNRSLPNEGMSA